MNGGDVSRRLQEHVERIRALGVHRLALFGSVARGTERADSDVDLLVEFEGAPTFDRYAALATFLEDTLRCNVDLITIGSLRDPIRAEILQEARDVAGLATIP
jgi:uncharacterized protein